MIVGKQQLNRLKRIATQCGLTLTNYQVSVPTTMFEVKEEHGSFVNILHAGQYQETLNFLKGQAEAFDIPIDDQWTQPYNRYLAPTLPQALKEISDLKEQLAAKEVMEKIYETVREEMFESMRKVALILVNHLPDYLIHMEKKQD